MLEQVLRETIPSKLSRFEKLTKGHDPYYFTSWDKENGFSIIRYWFWNKTRTGKNKKRVFVNEIEELLKHLNQARSITRIDFERRCPRTKSDGPCGFAVIIRILKYLEIVEIVGGKYRIAHPERIQELLGD